MLRQLIVATAALAASTLMPAQTATKLTATKANDYGLVYTLPKTVIDVTIEAEFVQRAPGQFSNYANRYLSIDDAILENSLSTKVKSVVITAHGEANPDNRWMMQLKAGQNVFVVLDEQGLPLAINTDKYPEPQEPELPHARKALATALELPAAQQAITQEMMMSASESKRAQLAADRIFELRETRNEIISGQAENTPPDGQAMQLILDNLTDQENALTAMFAGTEKSWTEVATYSFTPTTDEVKNMVIARLSPIDGFVDADDLSGQPIYLSMNVIALGEMPLDEKGEEKPFPKNGVAFQIPGSAQFIVSFDGMPMASENYDIAQLGFTYGLDPKLFTDKKAVTTVIFDPVTGGILKLDSQTK